MVVENGVSPRPGSRNEAQAPEQAAQALVEQAFALAQQERFEESLAACEEALHRFDGSAHPALRILMAQVLVHKTHALLGLKRPEAALAASDALLQRHEGAQEPVLRVAVAGALLTKAEALGGLNRLDEALRLYDEVFQRYGDASEQVLRHTAGLALLSKGVFQRLSNQPLEALATYETLLERFGTSEEPPLREVAAEALLYQGAVLAHLKRLEEALSVYAALSSRYGGPDEPLAVRLHVAEALSDAGAVLLFEAKRLWAEKREQALAFLERAGAQVAASLERRPRGPNALWNAGYIAFLQGRREQARSLLAESLRVGGERQRSRGIEDSALVPIPEDEEVRALVLAL